MWSAAGEDKECPTNPNPCQSADTAESVAFGHCLGYFW